jgi:hypothetical protein
MKACKLCLSEEEKRDQEEEKAIQHALETSIHPIDVILKAMKRSVCCVCVYVRVCVYACLNVSVFACM